MKKLVINIFFSLLTIGICGALFTRPLSKSEMLKSDRAFPGEPSCGELRAMWRFSKRQSRAAEVTNELPTYRDPFANNIWEPLPRLRSVLQKPPSRPWSQPVYGRIVRHPPAFPPRPSAFDELYREIHKDYRNDDEPEWGLSDDEDYRSPVIPPGMSPGMSPALSPSTRYNKVNYESPYNSFDRIKQMILAERAKDPTYQKVKAGEAPPAKNAQEESKEGITDRNSNYNKYSTEEEGKGDKLEVAKGGFEPDAPSGSERFRKPLRRSSAYAWMDPSLDEGYW